MRYYLTFPLVRFITRYKPRLPFKRYHIGRYREFWQCDVDIVDSDSPLTDTKILNVVVGIFEEFGFKNYVIKLNDRKILRGVFENSLRIKDYQTDLKIYRVVNKPR